MRWRDRLLIAAAVSSVANVSSVSAFAQSDIPYVQPGAVAMPAALQTHVPVLRLYAIESVPNTSTVEIPPNLSVPGSLRPIVESMLERSPMFRRQCRRIASASNLEVRLRNMQEHGISSRARTVIARARGGQIVATASIKPLEDVVELIAHELEHVIEHLDGVNLYARAELSGTGVRQGGDGSFETTRAVHVGRIVARETGAGR